MRATNFPPLLATVPLFFAFGANLDSATAQLIAADSMNTTDSNPDGYAVGGLDSPGAEHRGWLDNE